ncbi:MAG: hypothetical protein HY077_11970 [Elusimicrobia bacterium]|nr:hypothetical protein [Elusimicrobiota bacterium]
MPSPTPLLISVVLSLAPCFAAELERAPELPDLSRFQSALRETPAPAAAPAKMAEPAKPAGCPVPDLNGGAIGRGFFSSAYDVKIKDQAAGKISYEDGEYVFKDASGNLVAKTATKKASWGTKSVVTDCSGAKIGVIQEEFDSSRSNFTVSDGQGEPYANTGWTNASSVALKSVSGETVASVKNASSFADKFTVSLTPKADGRIIALVGVMNSSAGYRRSNEARRERMGEGPRGGGRNRY